MPDKKNKKIYTRLALHLTPPCWFTWILSNLQPRFGTAATADENYVITTAIFSTTSKFAQRHFLDCKPTLCPTEEGKKKKIATPLAIARNIGAIFEDPKFAV